MAYRMPKACLGIESAGGKPPHHHVLAQRPVTSLAPLQQTAAPPVVGLTFGAEPHPWFTAGRRLQQGAARNPLRVVRCEKQCD